MSGRAIAIVIVTAIQRDLNGRKGFDLTSLDEEIEQEITERWIHIVEDILSHE